LAWNPGQGLAELLRKAGSMRDGGSGQLAPKQGLPVLFLKMLLPAGQQVRAIDLVLVKNLADPSRQLIVLAAIIVVLQIGGDFPEGRMAQGLREQGGNAPTQHRLGKEILSKSILGNTVEQVPDKTGRQRKLEIGRDPVDKGNLLSDPLGHALIVHDDDLRHQRIVQRLPHDGAHLLKKVLQPVGLMKKQGRLLQNGLGSGR
jgi:hypothetical protein